MIRQLKEDNTYSEHENDIMLFWEKEEIYKKICMINMDGEKFDFIDGPPFCSSSNLHFGHILIGVIKSAVLNYKQMHNYNCSNKLGYDVHGLPMESVINKKLNVYTKQEVEKYGIGNYNRECKKMVNECSEAWTPIYNKIGRWADFNNVYKTMDVTFMESVWYVFKQLWEMDLIYRSCKIMPFCTKCTTSLSNFEISSSYKDISENSIYVKFKLKDYENIFFLAWTTTPWTIPSHISLCLNPENIYIKFHHKKNDEYYITSEEFCTREFKNEEMTILEKKKGIEYSNYEYTPPYNFFNRKYKILVDDFVDIKNETGIVHLAPLFGEDDFNVCLKNKIINYSDINDIMSVDDNGCFTDLILDFRGKYIFDTNKEIILDLKNKNRLHKIKNYTHSYPHCPRSDNPLIYKAIDCYFVNVIKIKEDLIKNNKKVSWIPKNIGENRFHNWLCDARDWNISRQRYFGTPIPIWISEDGTEIECMGSIDELILKSNLETKPTDIHREYIDNITIIKNGKILKRTTEIFDCWFESGSVLYAQHHYPFENNKNMMLDKEFLSDFVVEGMDQCRGWFYTMMILSTALFNKPAFKNVICTGLILAKDGRKISKKWNNYENPIDIINKYGADSVRLYLLNSVAVKAESFMFVNDDVEKIKFKLIQYYNVVKYFIEHLICFQQKKNILDIELYSSSQNIMDIWIISRLGTLLNYVEINMDNFYIDKVIPKLLIFIDELTNWYVRFNRDRISNGDTYSLSTLFFIIYNFTIIMAPFTPFITEMIYQHIKILLNKNCEDNLEENFEEIFENKYSYQKKMSSVHLCLYPNKKISNNNNIEKTMGLLQIVINAVRNLRSTGKISAKIPLKKISVICKNNSILKDINTIDEYIYDEINCLQINYETCIDNNINDDDIMYVILPNVKILGKKFRNDVNNIIKKLESIDQHTLKKFHCNEINELQLYYNDILLLFDKNDITTSMRCVNNNILTKIEKIPSEYIDNDIQENDIVILIDTTHDKHVMELYKIRLLINEIQKFRKECGLHPWNKICIYYETDDILKNIIKIHYNILYNKIKYDIKNIIENIKYMHTKIIKTSEINIILYIQII